MKSVRFEEEHRIEPIDDDFELMTANLLRVKKELTQRDQSPSSSPLKDQMVTEEIRQNDLIGSIRDEYEEYLSRTPFPKNHQEKLSFLLNQQFTLGSSIALFQLIFYFREAISPHLLSSIAAIAFQGILGRPSPAEKRCYSQLIAQCGVAQDEYCEFYAQELVDGEFDLGFIVLSNLGEKGLAYLIQIATKDIGGTGPRVLDHLSRSQSIIRSIIIPVLLLDIHPSSCKLANQKSLALSALNRLNCLLSTKPTLAFFSSLLTDPSINKPLLAGALRAAGLEGQKILLSWARDKSIGETLEGIIIGVMSWRIPSKQQLRIKTIEYSMEGGFLPGSLYQYEGKVEPSGLSDQSECSSDTLILNSSDFLTTLHTHLQQTTSSALRHQSANNHSLFVLADMLQSQEAQEKPQVSGEVIQLLIDKLDRKNAKIREIALMEIGNIGLPEAHAAIQKIGKCLWDVQSAVRSTACWTLSKICKSSSKKIINRLVELLRDNFWKVRTSACICLGIIAPAPTQSIIEGLIKVLNDGSIKKQTICDTILRLGDLGEELLLQFLRTTPKNDFKLRQAVISAFQSLQPSSPSLNPAIEQIFKNCKEGRVETRELCLQVLNTLRKRIGDQQESIQYFKAKSILPFYYYFLDDPSPKVRGIAAESILQFGSQAQLIFIEGMTRGQPLSKMECIKCLGRLGVQNFRAIILALRDDDSHVRQCAGATILSHFTPKQVVNQFKSKQNHSMSLLCNLKDLLGGQTKLEGEMRKFVKEVIYGLEGGRDENTSLN